MKSLKTVFSLAIAAALLTACSNQIKLTPVESDPMSGDLNKYFSVPEQTAVFTPGEEEGGALEVTLKCNEQLPVDNELQLGFEVLNADGEVVLTCKLSDDNLSEKDVKQLKEITAGDKVTVSIKTAETLDKESKPTQFRVLSSLAAKCNMPDGDYLITGAINGKYAMTMNISLNEGRVAGTYYYNKYGPNHTIDVTGDYNPETETLTIKEYTNGLNTGIFNGVVSSPKTYDGQFENPVTFKVMPFSLTVTKK